MTSILKVMGQSEPINVRRKDGTNVSKCIIRLKEVGGDFANEYVAAVLGNLATVKFATGELVAADLNFSSHESNGLFYQDVLVREIVRVSSAF